MQSENQSSEAPGSTGDSLRAVGCNRLLAEIADRLERGGDKLIHQVDNGIIFPAGRIEAHSHALLMLRIADALRHPATPAVRRRESASVPCTGVVRLEIGG